LSCLRIFVLIILLCATPCFAQNKKRPNSRSSAPQPSTELIAIVDEHMPEVWKQFRSVDGGFSILFPGEPKETIQVQSFQEQQFSTHLFQLLSPNAEYEVSYVDFPVRVDEQEKIEGTLDGIRTDTIEKDKGRLLKESPLTIAGRPGRYINWRTEKGAVWQARYFLAGYRIYMLSFGVPDEAASEEINKFRESLAGKFFDSFRLVTTVKQKSG
jgi:hypothetical protein